MSVPALLHEFILRENDVTTYIDKTIPSAVPKSKSANFKLYTNATKMTSGYKNLHSAHLLESAICACNHH